MKKRISWKGIISLLICLMMLLACLPLSVLADDTVVLSMEQATSVTVAPEGEVLCSFTPSKDGYYRFYSQSTCDPKATLYDANMESLIYNDDSELGSNGYDFILKFKLQAGETYYLAVSAYEEEQITCNVLVEEAVGVVSAKLNKKPNRTDVVEGYEYDTVSLSGLVVEFTLANGKTEFWFYDNEDLVAGSTVDYYPVEEDGSFSIEVVCDDAVLQIPYTVIKNPVKSITYSGSGYTFYENTHGFFDSEYGHYIYDCYLDDDDTFIVEYTDGTSEELSVYDDFPYMNIDVNDNQNNVGWNLGENAITVYYLGKETTVPVSILPCPYKSVTVNANPTEKVFFGDMRCGDVNEGTYYFMPYDLTGISLTFENTDGTKVTYTAEDFDLENQELDGYIYDMEVIACAQLGMADCVMHYKGLDVTFQVEVVESPVESLEILGIAKNLLYESRYYPFMNGLSVKLTMKDGTSQTVELNDETVQYTMDYGFEYVITVGDYTVIGYTEYDENDKEIYRFNCVDKVAYYTDFSFIDSREVVDVEISDFAPDGDGMVLTVIYEGQEENETLTVKTLCSKRWNGFYNEYFAKTENGVLYYDIAEDYDENDVLAGYYVTVLDTEVYVEADNEGMGDLDGDGKITAKDALQVLRYAVGKAEFTVVQETNGDVNKDGKIDAKDALEMLKYAVGKPSVLDKFFAE